MQLADLFAAPLGVLSVLCPSRAIHASGLAGGFDLPFDSNLITGAFYTFIEDNK